MGNQLDLRLNDLRDRMKERGIDLVVLGPSSHMQWLAGLNPHGDERPVLVLVSATFCGTLMPALNAAVARTQTTLPLFEWTDNEGAGDALTTLISACKVPAVAPSIALDETMRADFALLVLDQFNRPNHQFLEHSVGHLRAIKDASEYASLMESARINDLAFAAAFDALKPGITELELCQVIKAAHSAHGASTAFCSVCFGQNSAFPHHSSGQTALQRDMAILIDAGCRWDGYCSDMTRCAWFGTASDEFLSVARVVEEALDAGIASAAVGNLANQVDAAARTTIAAAGYGSYFTHRTGHGIGLDVHEAPYLTASSQDKLNAGNVFTVEPGIYLPGKFGIRLEEEVFLHSGRSEVLTKFPRLNLVS